MPGAKPQYARDRTFHLHHVRLEIAIDVENKRIAGSSSLTVSPVVEGLQTIELDAIELTIRGARLDSGEPLPFEVGDKTVREVMTARPSIVSLEASSSVEELRQLVDTLHQKKRPLELTGGEDDANLLEEECQNLRGELDVTRAANEALIDARKNLSTDLDALTKER